jgi:hypothetical protein
MTYSPTALLVFALEHLPNAFRNLTYCPRFTFEVRMAFLMGYHISVKHSIPASLALFGLFLVPTMLVSDGHAQINGAPASVTSPGFGGRAINGPPASATSLGPRGYAPPREFHNGEFHNGQSHNGEFHNGEKHRQQRPGDRTHQRDGAAPFLYAVPVPVPYGADLNATNDEADPDADPPADPNDQGGPTIFDRRGSGAASYVPPVKNAPAPHSTQLADASEADPQPDPPQEPVVLVFKDGHKVEVGNYAIQGKTLFDLTTGRVHKIALADLDLEATRKQNEDRGVTFEVPPGSQAH